MPVIRPIKVDRTMKIMGRIDKDFSRHRPSFPGGRLFVAGFDEK